MSAGDPDALRLALGLARGQGVRSKSKDHGECSNLFLIFVAGRFVCVDPSSRPRRNSIPRLEIDLFNLGPLMIGNLATFKRLIGPVNKRWAPRPLDVFIRFIWGKVDDVEIDDVLSDRRARARAGISASVGERCRWPRNLLGRLRVFAASACVCNVNSRAPNRSLLLGAQFAARYRFPYACAYFRVAFSYRRT